jgi:hypothetical protein
MGFTFQAWALRGAAVLRPKKENAWHGARMVSAGDSGDV